MEAGARLPPIRIAAAIATHAARGSQSRFPVNLGMSRPQRPEEAPAQRMRVAAAKGATKRFVYSPIRSVTKLKPVVTKGNVTIVTVVATRPFATANGCSLDLRNR